WDFWPPKRGGLLARFARRRVGAGACDAGNRPQGQCKTDGNSGSNQYENDSKPGGRIRRFSVRLAEHRRREGSPGLAHLARALLAEGVPVADQSVTDAVDRREGPTQKRAV